jgi:hypothetical protein
LQAPDEGEALAVDGAAGHELQQAVVVEQLGHLADARQHLALAHDRALAVAADRGGRLRASELHRRAAPGAGRAVVALGWAGGFSHEGKGGACAAEDRQFQKKSAVSQRQKVIFCY